MRVLLDENLSQRFRQQLPGHDVYTAKYMGWEGKTNGDLIAAMKAEHFQALVTYDKSLPSQQNLQSAGIGVILIAQPRSYRNLLQLVPDVLRALDFLQPGQVITVPATTT